MEDRTINALAGGEPDPAGALRCERCDSIEDVQEESSRTAYRWEGPMDSPDNPNRPVRLCRPCAKEHHEHWDATWDEYYSGRL